LAHTPDPACDRSTPDARAEVVTHRDPTGGESRSEYRRPFQPLSATLREVLLSGFASPALDWLLGLSDNPSPSRAVRAHAEVALALISGVRFLEADPSASNRQAIESAVIESSLWLVDARAIHEDGSCCWDHSAWDTAAVVRALCHVLRSPLGAVGLDSEDRLSSVAECVVSGVSWLVRRLSRAEGHHVSEALNPAEYAEIGWAVAESLMWNPESTDSVALKALGVRADTVVGGVCESLIRRRSEKMIEIRGEDEPTALATIWWGDFFGTAEVLRFYQAVEAASREGLIDLDVSLRRTIRESVARCCLLIEHSHFDGVWGAYLDTIALLGAYVELGRRPEGLFPPGPESDHIAPQPRVIFRVLRWMCDPTQRSSDGSILHTAFLTTFFAHTVIDVAVGWPFAMETIAIVYDEMSLLMETGVSQSRVDQVNAILARDDALARVANVEKNVAQLRQKGAYAGWLRSRIVASAVLVLAGAGCTVLVGQLTGWVSTTIASANTINVLTMVGVAVTIIVAVITVLWSVGRPANGEG
jgi:hypothetical protein